MVQNYRGLVHYTIQIIKSLHFITESLDFFLTPISCVANQYTPPIKKITYVNPSYLQNSTHGAVPTLPTQLEFSERKVHVGTTEPVS